MPSGYQQSHIEGNPKNSGLYIFRAKIPANWCAKPHFHSVDEFMTVIEGSCFLGIGSAYDESQANELCLGAFSVVRARVAHLFFTRESCVIQVHGEGPQKITYLSEADDPQKI